MHIIRNQVVQVGLGVTFESPAILCRKQGRQHETEEHEKCGEAAHLLDGTFGHAALGHV